MTYNINDQIDDLFVQIRLCLGRLKESNPEAADEIRGIITQLEDCVETLVVDSLKQKNPEGSSKKTTKAPAKKTG